ncbi:hypothetical protein GW17_00059595 [Ensete ventricosum]|nr:hypothetical protein GW17_00059595 [Ensete ventricosum]
MRMRVLFRERTKPVCARSPASQSLRHGAELVRMSGDSGDGSGVLMLEWRSPGEEGVVLLGVNSGMWRRELGLTECELGGESGFLAERVNSGANPEIWSRGRTRAQIRGFGREGELGRKSGDLAERVNSGANPEIWPRE